MTQINIMIGYDRREPIAYHVLVSSIIRHTSCPVSITPLALTQLQRLWQPSAVGSTEFSMTRWLCPLLAKYDGLVVYMDCDMLVQHNLVELLLYPILQPEKAVWVCQHDYTPSQDTKMWGVENKPYHRKNWSSFIIFDAHRCQTLSRAYLHAATPMDLHRFTWLPDDAIGSLPLEWNYLVGEPQQSAHPPKIIHWTNGGPWLTAYKDAPYADLWFAEYEAMCGPSRP